MKALVGAFNQEKALVGAFSVITNLRIEFGWNFLEHYWLHTRPGSDLITRRLAAADDEAGAWLLASGPHNAA